MYGNILSESKYPNEFVEIAGETLFLLLRFFLLVNSRRICFATSLHIPVVSCVLILSQVGLCETYSLMPAPIILLDRYY